MEVKTKAETPAQSLSVVADMRANSWKYRIEPFRILSNVYYVGNAWVGAYLIDTGEGLIMLDSCFKEVQWMLFDSIHKAGFDPADIKLLLLSHAHFDHVGGARFIQEVSHCKTFLGPDDMFMVEERPELLLEPVDAFKIDEVYDYNSEIRLGNTTVRPVHTPGHTPGCTSIFFESEFQGKTYTLATHGGLGGTILEKKELRRLGLPFSLQTDYLQGLRRLEKMDVDVFLPMHKGYYNIFDLAAQDDGSGAAFIRPGDWSIVMKKRAEMFEEQLKKEKMEEDF